VSEQTGEAKAAALRFARGAEERASERANKKWGRGCEGRGQMAIGPARWRPAATVVLKWPLVCVFILLGIFFSNKILLTNSLPKYTLFKFSRVYRDIMCTYVSRYNMHLNA